jgi:hypothetical protein
MPSWVPNAERPTEIELRGRCPRCKHDMTFTHPLVVALGVKELALEHARAATEALFEEGVDLSSGEVHIDAWCCCAREHPGAPKDRSGCGAPFVMQVRWP